MQLETMALLRAEVMHLQELLLQLLSFKRPVPGWILARLLGVVCRFVEQLVILTATTSASVQNLTPRFQGP